MGGGWDFSGEAGKYIFMWVYLPPLFSWRIFLNFSLIQT
jgi:hypothetical protein